MKGRDFGQPRDDGGPAFPSGVTLRDHFAAAALIGALAGRTDADLVVTKRDGPEAIARASYYMADLMLAERAK